MDNRKCKGAVINGQLKYIKKKWGQQGQSEAMKFAGITKAPRDGAWVPIRKNHLLYEWLIRNKGRKQVSEAARYTAMDLGIFSFIFSFVGMQKLLEKAKLNYKTLFDYGDIIIEKLDERKVKIIMKDVGTEDFLCDVWEGAIRGLMDITKSGGTINRATPDGPEDCAYIVRWG